MEKFNWHSKCSPAWKQKFHWIFHCFGRLRYSIARMLRDHCLRHFMALQQFLTFLPSSRPHQLRAVLYINMLSQFHIREILSDKRWWMDYKCLFIGSQAIISLARPVPAQISALSSMCVTSNNWSPIFKPNPLLQYHNYPLVNPWSLSVLNCH